MTVDGAAFWNGEGICGVGDVTQKRVEWPMSTVFESVDVGVNDKSRLDRQA